MFEPILNLLALRVYEGEAVSSARVDPSYLRFTFCGQWFDFLRVKPRDINNNNNNGDEDVILKLNWRWFKLFHAYSISFNSSNVGKFFWRWILKAVSKFRNRKRKSFCCCSRSPQNVKIGTLTLKSCSDGKEMYKKAWCTSKIVVLPI